MREATGVTPEEKTRHRLQAATFSVSKQLIGDRTATVGIVGLGSYGLRLAIMFSRGRFSVLGSDFDPQRIEALQKRRTYLPEISAQEVGLARDLGFQATTDLSQVCQSDVVLLSIPTVLGDDGRANLRLVREIAFSIASTLRAGQLVIVESPICLGITEEVLVPILEGANDAQIKVSRNSPALNDVFVGVSPQRYVSASSAVGLSEVPKIAAGTDEYSTELIASLYSTIFGKVICVSSPSVAEMSRLFECSYQTVNRALIDELKQISLGCGVDLQEAINVVRSEPFGFQDFFPDLGTEDLKTQLESAGLCVKAREKGISANLLEVGVEIDRAATHRARIRYQTG